MCSKRYVPDLEVDDPRLGDALRDHMSPKMLAALTTGPKCAGPKSL